MFNWGQNKIIRWHFWHNIQHNVTQIDQLACTLLFINFWTSWELHFLENKSLRFSRCIKHFLNFISFHLHKDKFNLIQRSINYYYFFFTVIFNSDIRVKMADSASFELLLSANSIYERTVWKNTYPSNHVKVTHCTK